MYEITFQFENGAQEVHFSAAPGSTILEAAKAANVAIDAPCNGNGSCGKCRVKLVSGDVTTSPMRITPPAGGSAARQSPRVTSPFSSPTSPPPIRAG